MSRTTDGPVAVLTAADVANGILTLQGVHDDVAARDRSANLAGAAILIGIYLDAGASPLNAGSVTAYDSARPFADPNLHLAELVQSDVLAQLNANGWEIPDDGVVTDSGLGGPAQTSAEAAYGHLMLIGPAIPGFFATPSQMPGALIEPLYITDPFEASIAATATGQNAIAAGIARAAEQDLTATPNVSTPVLPAAVVGETPLAESVVGSTPLIRVWRVPPAAPEQGAITVAAFDPARTRLVLHAGSLQPVPGQSWVNGPQVGAVERGSLLGALDRGFKLADARGGWFSQGRTVSPLIAGAASVVIYADGGADIGAWGHDVPAPRRSVASVRQNLQLLIDAGQPQLQHAVDERQLEQWWGVAFRGALLVSRRPRSASQHPGSSSGPPERTSVSPRSPTLCSLTVSSAHSSWTSTPLWSEVSSMRERQRSAQPALRVGFFPSWPGRPRQLLTSLLAERALPRCPTAPMSPHAAETSLPCSPDESLSAMDLSPAPRLRPNNLVFRLPVSQPAHKWDSASVEEPVRS